MESFTTSEVATLLGVSDQTIRRMIADGALPGIRLADNAWHRVEKKTLIAYAQARNLTLDWSLVEREIAK